ncbi:hypothetical protein SASPL_115380 [Salvia splendens]|uniref:Uncharacterized protein n=1 Tax=Salvia splendens TaxID=180675 RepID=A0A8X8Y6F9_SALSN|nr:hypothetical protein SASPL_115380 [Salvia splendens]
MMRSGGRCIVSFLLIDYVLLIFAYVFASVASTMRLQSEGGETALFFQQNSSAANVFAFKIQDKKGRMHRFISDSGKLTTDLKGYSAGR